MVYTPLKSESLLRKPNFLSKGGVKVLEIAVVAVFAPIRFSLVRISIRDVVADRNPRCPFMEAFFGHIFLTV